MTTLAVAKKCGAVAIAADRLTTQGTCKCPPDLRVSQSKIVHVNGSYIGVEGSTAHIRVLESLARNRPKVFHLTSVASVFETFRRLHRILVDDYFLKTEEDDKEQPYESHELQVLIANKTGIYEVQGYREVMQFERFWAGGSGYRFALGAMEALYDDPSLSAREIVERGVQVGCRFDDSSGLPLESYEVTLTKSRASPRARQR